MCVEKKRYAVWRGSHTRLYAVVDCNSFEWKTIFIKSNLYFNLEIFLAKHYTVYIYSLSISTFECVMILIFREKFKFASQTFGHQRCFFFANVIQQQYTSFRWSFRSYFKNDLFIITALFVSFKKICHWVFVWVHCYFLIFEQNIYSKFHYFLKM